MKKISDENYDFDYEKIYRNFKWDVPEYFGFDVVDRRAMDRTKTALLSIHANGSHDYHTFYDLSVQSNKFANVQVEVKDADLNPNTLVQTTTINLKSNAELAGESVLLTETGGDTGIFRGTKTISGKIKRNELRKVEK